MMKRMLGLDAAAAGRAAWSSPTDTGQGRISPIDPIHTR
jgi:hypothetical protein